jgi:hypothetical protein
MDRQLKRLTWRIEEMQKVISPACPKHAAKAGAGPDEKKGVAYQDVKNLNMQELKNGWKADYTSVPDAFIELEFPFSVRADSNPQYRQKINQCVLYRTDLYHRRGGERCPIIH